MSCARQRVEPAAVQAPSLLPRHLLRCFPNLAPHARHTGERSASLAPWIISDCPLAIGEWARLPCQGLAAHDIPGMPAGGIAFSALDAGSAPRSPPITTDRRWRQPHSSLAQSRIVIPGVLRASRPLNAVAPGHTDSWHKKKVSTAQEPSFVPPQWQAPHHVRHFCILTEKRVPRPLSERGALSGFKVQDATKNGCTLQIQPRDKPTGFRRHFQTPQRGLKADQISKKPEKPHTKPTEKLTRTKHNIMNFINLYHTHRARIGIIKKAR